MLEWMALFLVCYVVGSIPSAYLLAKWLRGVDIRTIGYRNAGVANIWRQLSPKAAVLVLLIDAGKGIAAVSIAKKFMPGDTATMLAGIAAVAGHNWPAFLRFHGGRGAATAIGVLTSVLPFVAVPLAVFSIIPLWVTNRFTVALLCIFIPMPFLAWKFDAPSHLVWFSIALPVLVLLSHLLAELLWPGKPPIPVPEAPRSA
ncbi:MAG: glycerol-3-phosphate acyltransferase [Dehalococcoidia bacterium]|nr:glycerol-3-phosphate acyltransferase [Dehalococcoidia bacterium]